MGLKNKDKLAVLAELADIIAARRTAGADNSYTASLLSKGVEKCARKFGEEAIELILASASGDKAHSAAEAADVLYHMLVLLEAANVPMDDVLYHLEARQGTSGHAEKSARTS